MAVNDEPISIAYASDGVSVAFSFPYYFKAFADLVVTFRDSTGAVATKVLNTDYAVSGVIDPKLNIYSSGGLVTFLAAPAAAGQVRITRRTAPIQGSVYTPGDSFPVKAHEVSQDTAQLVIQQFGCQGIADGPPTHGIFRDGDWYRHATPTPSGVFGWIYISGLWYEFGQISETAAG